LHDHRVVRIYSHYPSIDWKKFTFYRHPIYTFDFIALDGKEKWTSYTVYQECLRYIDADSLERKLPPNLDFEVSQEPELGESGLSQGLESHHLSNQSSYDAASLEEADSQTSRAGSRDVTPDTSLS
jgi:hypothetical protein